MVSSGDDDGGGGNVSCSGNVQISEIFYPEKFENFKQKKLTK